MNRTSSVLIALLLSPTIILSQEKSMAKTFTVDGKQVVCTVETYAPPQVFRADAGIADRMTPVHCSHVFFSRLAAGDIDGAAALSNDPEKAAAKYKRQRERAGAEEFNKMYGAYFSGSAKIKYCLTLGAHSMLIVHSDDMAVDLAQFYVKAGNVFLVEEKESAERNLLGKIYGQLKDDEGNVVVK